MPITHLDQSLSNEPLIAASILAADFAHLAEDCRTVIEAGVDLLHLDVMDGHFVPNLTMGPALCESLRREFPDICLDVHLMVTDPEQYIEPFSKSGASHLTFHVEATGNPIELSKEIRRAGMTSGIAINPPTDISAISDLSNAFDMILIMSVNPGFAGQAFIPEVLEKARHLRGTLTDGQWLEIDGGVNSENIDDCVQAGCNILVAASAIFNQNDCVAAVRNLKTSAGISPSRV